MVNLDSFLANFAPWREIAVIFVPIMTESWQVQYPPVMHQGCSGDRIILDPHVFPQPEGGVVLAMSRFPNLQ